MAQQQRHRQLELEAAAAAFRSADRITAITALGNGNVNDTYRVDSADGAFVLQRINTAVFQQPEQVMANLQRLSEHVRTKLQAPPAQLRGLRWEMPEVLRSVIDQQPYYRSEQNGFWRALSYVANARTVDVIEHRQQAQELGWGLGLFHHLIADLPIEQLADTLPGFHITPNYLVRYHQALVRSEAAPSAASNHCMAFIREREQQATVLEQAKARGLLPLRAIHGDPKINNVMLDRCSGQAVALIDLDTVKPGLVHYDLGDCLRSCCNRLGEETQQLDAVQFDLDLAGAILEGYLSSAGDLLTAQELALIPDAARLISFELGLRFFTDHLNGNTYFRVSHSEHNLQRALVQFQLCASIEAQEPALRDLVERVALAQGG